MVFLLRICSLGSECSTLGRPLPRLPRLIPENGRGSFLPKMNIEGRSFHTYFSGRFYQSPPYSTSFFLSVPASLEKIVHPQLLSLLLSYFPLLILVLLPLSP